METKTKLKIDREILKLKKEPKQKIRFKQHFKNKNYMVTIEKPKNLAISIYLASVIFVNEMVKKPFTYGLKIGYYDEEKLKLIKVLNIEEIEKPKSIFKRF